MDGTRSTYPFSERPETHIAIPTDAKTILDVGCSSGGLAAGLKRARDGVVVVGLELNDESASQAESHCDEVIVGRFPEAAPADRTFDCIVFNDVLEHLVDPWTALVRARSMLSSTGSVVATIPNMRYWPVLRRLVMHGEWQYEDLGVMDRTHLRWFTRSSMVGLFETSGYRVEEVIGLDNATTRGLRLLNILSGDRFADAAHSQFVLRGRPVASAASTSDSR